MFQSKVFLVVFLCLKGSNSGFSLEKDVLWNDNLLLDVVFTAGGGGISWAGVSTVRVAESGVCNGEGIGVLVLRV